ncbi:MAG: ArnT family glycosyltransferase [bacterium]
MRHRALVWGVLACYAALVTAAALTYAPRADEGFFASPALNLATKGFMGTTVLEGSHAFLKDIHRYTYWMTPLHFIAQAAWYEVVGFGLFRMRLLSLIFALAALGAWYSIAGRLSGSRAVAVAAVALAAFDFNFVVGGSSGRMDMMAAALNFCGIAAYLALRERNLHGAVLAGNACAAASGLTHPVSGILAFLCQAILLLYFDRGRPGARLIAIAALPYVAGAAAWGAYILKDPAAFAAQFSTNATMSGRLNALHAPWMGVCNEITDRYAGGYGLLSRSVRVSGPSYLKSLMLLLYGAGLAGSLLNRKMRRNKGYRALLLMLAAVFLALSILDAQKAYYYLVHTIPFFAALAAWWLVTVVRGRRIPTWVPASAVASILLVQAAGVAYRAWQNPYANVYAPAMKFLRERAGADDVIFGSASAAFALGFDSRLVDDVRLGFYTGRKPSFVILEEEYRQAIQDYALHQPDVYSFIRRRVTTEYVPVYEQADYTILVSRERLARHPGAPIANRR